YEVQVQSTEKGYFTTLFVDITERKRTVNELEAGDAVLNLANRHIERKSNPHGSLVYAAARDVTSRIVDREELARQANYIESLFAAIPDLTFVLDAEGTFLDARAGRDAQFFVSREAFIGRNVIDVFPEPAAGALKGAITRAARNKTYVSVSYELPRADGNALFEARLTPIDDDRVIGMVRDITESARAQEALEARDTLLKKLSREVPGAIFQYRYAPDRSSWFPFVSDGIRDVYELTPDDVMTDASPILERVHPQDLDRLKHSIRESFETLCLWTCEYRVNLPSRGERWLQGSANPERLDDGSVLWHGYLTDITDRKRMEGELRDSEHRFDLAIAGTGAGLWDWDMVNDRVYFSPRWKAMLGYSDSEVENSLDGWRSLWHPDDVESIEQAIQQHLDGQTSTYEIEHRLRARNGEWRRILTRGELVRDESSVPVRWVGTNIDLTHTREMEEELVRSRQHLASVVQTQQEMISRFLPDTTLTFVNDAYCRFFAKTRDELIGTRFIESIPEDQRDAVEASFADLCAEHPVRTYSQPVTAPSGSKAWQEWTDHAIIDADGTVVEIQSTARDITIRVEAQQALVAAKEAAETANKAKSQFLANMSHEIRTPLNGVIGFTDLLLQTPLDPVQRQYAESASTSGAALLGIINDILDFSKIEAGKLDMEIVRTDLVELVEQAADIITYHAAQKGLELLVHLDPAMPRYVHTDPGRLKQVLTNLLSNAVKFTERGEVEIKVEFDAMTTGRGRYRFSVRDTGIGIRADQKERLFKAFSQADSSTTRKFGGTGLGLIISNLLAEKMGGRI
ncbi:MAG TPA: PAS domain S-box protein, partial [Spirochaetia bacterium]|nr:PAS domain S-box protein [Spirochaetia bacterium]